MDQNNSTPSITRPKQSVDFDWRVSKLRTRWKRWLGNKTRSDKDYWVTLLDSNWMGWATKLTGKHIRINNATRDSIKKLFTEAIDKATIGDFIKLDDLYVQDKYNL